MVSMETKVKRPSKPSSIQVAMSNCIVNRRIHAITIGAAPKASRPSAVPRSQGLISNAD